jgi:hypothetical protein
MKKTSMTSDEQILKIMLTQQGEVVCTDKQFTFGPGASTYTLIRIKYMGRFPKTFIQYMMQTYPSMTGVSVHHGCPVIEIKND